MRKGQRFGYWKVLDSQNHYYDKNSNKPRIKCMDVRNKEIYYVDKYNLLNGESKGCGELRSNNRGDWSTKVKNKHLPMYVHYFPHFRKYRVMKKVEGKVKTFGYFSKLKDAKELAESLRG